MNSVMKKVLVVSLSLLFLVYLGFQGYRYFSKPFKTETVVDYTVADTLTVDGIAIRDEVIIDQVPSGVCRYVHELGSKVLKGNTVAEVFASEQDVINRNISQNIAEEITSLQSAQENGDYYAANADMLSGQIAELTGNIIDMSYSNVVQRIHDTKQNLTLLLNKKQISIGKEQDYSQRIASLEAEKAQMEASSGGVLATIEAPVTGYFSQTIDGYEHLKGSDILDMDTSTVLEMIKKVQPTASSSYIGKLVTNHNWYFAAAVPTEFVERFQNSPSVNLDFNLINTREVEAYVYKIFEESVEGKSVVIFRCDTLSDEIISLRNQTVDVQFRFYSGLRVSKEAIRYVGDVRGVYVVDQYDMKFKPIDPMPLYEDNSFILCSEGYGGENSLKLYDEIIVEGTDLYDGKPVS